MSTLPTPRHFTVSEYMLLADRQDPGPEGYGSTRIARGDDPLAPLALAGQAPAPLRAADLLPRRPR